MNASYVQRGEYIDVVPENDVKAGDIVVRGRLVGVSKLDIKAGTLGALATTGVYDVAKGETAFAAGDKVYWNAAEGKAAAEGGGDEAEYFGKDSGKLVLTGNAWAVQDNNTLKSGRLTVFLQEQDKAETVADEQGQSEQ